jgi:H+/Na+-translocating ferredoxin:NAD+ oxidoreductase subunit G
MDGAKGNALLTVVAVAIFAAAGAYLIGASNDFSKDRIAANQRARLIARLNSVLDPSLRSHDLRTVRLAAADRDLLGSAAPVDVFVAFDAGEPVAAVFAAVAPDGYNAPIRLLIGVSSSATLTGVRPVSHRETAGLGDRIEPAKSDWILRFTGASLDRPPRERWAVDRDDGDFDSLSGATITSRAVVKAVKNTLLYFEQHRDELFRDAAARAADANAD